MNKLKNSMKQIGTKKTSKKSTLIITDDVYRFLMDITMPAVLDHTASHADMISNVVLDKVRERINNAYYQNRP